MGIPSNNRIWFNQQKNSSPNSDERHRVGGLDLDERSGTLRCRRQGKENIVCLKFVQEGEQNAVEILNQNIGDGLLITQEKSGTALRIMGIGVSYGIPAIDISHQGNSSKDTAAIKLDCSNEGKGKAIGIDCTNMNGQPFISVNDKDNKGLIPILVNGELRHLKYI